mgnify:CR=1 FL=1
MKILDQDRTSSVAGGTTLSGFPATNVENDRPRQPWISTTQSSETFTISLDCDAQNPAQALFLHGLMADSCTWVLKNNGGSTVDSGTLDMSYPAESNQSGNPNSLNTYFVNQAHLRRSFFVVLLVGAKSSRRTLPPVSLSILEPSSQPGRRSPRARRETKDVDLPIC